MQIMKITRRVNQQFFITLSALLLTVRMLSAETVNVTVPGTLHSLVSDTGVTQLTVHGSVDASDLYWIGREMPSLSALDLSHANITAYSGKMLNGRVTYPASTIPPSVFAGTSLAMLSLPADSDVTIAEAAFAGTQITAIVLTDNVTSAGRGAFSSCPVLRSVTLSPKTTYGASVFADCPALETVGLNGVTDIADGMFGNCTSLSTVAGSGNVAVIGARAFLGCTALQQFTFGQDLTIIGPSAFQNTGLQQARLSASPLLRSVGAFAFANNEALTDVIFSADAPARIAEGAFLDCTELTGITLPASLTRLDDYVLKGAGAASAHSILPAAIDTIGAYALKDNRAVTELTLPANLSYIADGAMEGMTGLVAIDGTELQGVPGLGNDVWAGVNQPAVALKIQPAVIDDFRNAGQWQNFSISGIDGADPVIADGISAAPEIRGRFTGTDLHVTCTGADISTLRLYDQAATLLVTTAPCTNAVTIPTATFATRFYIVSLRLTDGRDAVLKIAR